MSDSENSKMVHNILNRRKRQFVEGHSGLSRAAIKNISKMYKKMDAEKNSTRSTNSAQDDPHLRTDDEILHDSKTIGSNVDILNSTKTKLAADPQVLKNNNGRVSERSDKENNEPLVSPTRKIIKPRERANQVLDRHWMKKMFNDIFSEQKNFAIDQETNIKRYSKMENGKIYLAKGIYADMGTWVDLASKPDNLLFCGLVSLTWTKEELPLQALDVSKLRNPQYNGKNITQASPKKLKRLFAIYNDQLHKRNQLLPKEERRDDFELYKAVMEMKTTLSNKFRDSRLH